LAIGFYISKSPTEPASDTTTQKETITEQKPVSSPSPQPLSKSTETRTELATESALDLYQNQRMRLKPPNLKRKEFLIFPDNYSVGTLYYQDSSLSEKMSGHASVKHR
jgi:hypothetical protein